MDDGGEESFAGVTDARRIARGAAGRRRRIRTGAIAVAAVALLGATVPALVDAATSRDEPTVSRDPPPDDNLYDGPTRGSLADDAAFVAGVRALPWLAVGMTGVADVPAADRHVVFAGDVPDGRWALVVAARGAVAAPAALSQNATSGPDLLDAVWFTGPPDATAGELSLAAYTGPLQPGRSTALLDRASGVLVVVAGPRDAVEVSERPEIAADGSTSREFRTAETDEGITVVRLGAGSSTAAVYRVVRDGSRTPLLPSTTVIDGPDASPSIGFPRGEPGETGRSAAAYAAQRLLAEIGRPAADVEVTAQWVGPVPAQGPGQAAVVTAVLPNGVIAVAGQWLLPAGADGSVQGADCGRAVLPAGAPVARRVYALVCEVVDDTGAPAQTSLVVVGPPEVAFVRTYDAGGSFLSEHPAQDGVVVARLPIGTWTVEGVTHGGISLGRVGLVSDAAALAE